MGRLKCKPFSEPKPEFGIMSLTILLEAIYDLGVDSRQEANTGKSRHLMAWRPEITFFWNSARVELS
jgi:hypothetical protein